MSLLCFSGHVFLKCCEMIHLFCDSCSVLRYEGRVIQVDFFELEKKKKKTTANTMINIYWISPKKKRQVRERVKIMVVKSTSHNKLNQVQRRTWNDFSFMYNKNSNILMTLHKIDIYIYINRMSSHPIEASRILRVCFYLPTGLKVHWGFYNSQRHFVY